MPSQSKCSAREQNAYVPELAGVAELADNKGFTEYAKKTESDADESLRTLLKCLYAPRAVELALPALNESQPPLPWARQAPDARHRNIENDVIIPARIRLPFHKPGDRTRDGSADEHASLFHRERTGKIGNCQKR